MHFAESLDPADRQLHFLFDHADGAFGQLHGIRADRKPRILVISQPRQRGPHRVVEVDVRGAVLLDITFECFSRQINAGVYAATAAEALETQHGFAAGDDWVEVCRSWQKKVRPNDLAQYQQHFAHLARA
ncbi:MAG TPA: hypothetical protein VG713_20460 [Pirellulales bacterium]|nr:hypothetical protein [Pirellulales bacterium]